MWAAYKGYPACVDLFLRWGANVNSTDETGFTALHWALVKGSQACIQKLVEYGSDRYAVTSTNKTPAVVAQEMGSTRAWHRALAELGFNEDGTAKKLPLPYTSFIKDRAFLNKFFFLFPFGLLILVFTILSRMLIFISVPLTIFLAYTLQWAAQQVLLWAPPDMKHLHRTVSSLHSNLIISNLRPHQPYLAGVFAASLFWVVVHWAMTILPSRYVVFLAVSTSLMKGSNLFFSSSTKSTFRHLLFILHIFLCLQHDRRSWLRTQSWKQKSAESCCR